MHTRHRFRYAAVDGVQILELPYVGDSLSLIALLPEKQDGLPGLEGQLTLGNWQKWTSGLASQEVIVYLAALQDHVAIRAETVVGSRWALPRRSIHVRLIFPE